MEPLGLPPRLRWTPVVVAGAVAFVALAWLRAPSGLEHAPLRFAPDPPAPTTSAGPALRAWELPEGAWVGAFQAGTLRSLLGGHREASPGVGDMAANGMLLGGEVPGLSPFIGGSAVLAPDGRTLAAWGAGELKVRDVTTGAEISAWTTQLALGGLHWSPDSQVLGVARVEGYSLWHRSGTRLANEPAGTLLGVFSSMALVADSSGVRVQSWSGDVVRAWPDLRLGRVLPSGSFDPGARFVAVRGLVDEGGLEGIWLLGVFGTEREFLAGPYAGLAWSGDGAALYYTTSAGLRARPVDASHHDTLLAEVALPAGELVHLRAYDHALVPAGVLATSTGETHRLDSGWAAGPPRQVRPQEGGLQGVPLGVDGFSVTVKQQAETTVVDATDLAVGSILGAAATDRSLFLLTETASRGALLQIPLWSELVHEPHRRVSVVATPTVALLRLEFVESGDVMVAGDQSAVAVVARQEEGPVTYLLGMWTGIGPSRCPPSSLATCSLGEVPMQAVTFSPDANWLLLRDQQGFAHAWSTRGRGLISLGLAVTPDTSWAAS